MINQGTGGKLIVTSSIAGRQGYPNTPRWKKLDLDLMDVGDSSGTGEAFESFSGANLICRKGVAEDLVGTALFLASSDSDYMAGQTMMIDGGMVLMLRIERLTSVAAATFTIEPIAGPPTDLATLINQIRAIRRHTDVVTLPRQLRNVRARSLRRGRKEAGLSIEITFEAADWAASCVAAQRAID
jgi:hypothetical protein